MSTPRIDLLAPFDLSTQQIQALVGDALHGADDGDLFVELRQVQSLLLEDSHIKRASYSEDSGFGLRRVDGAGSALVHSSNLAGSRLKDAAQELAALASDKQTQSIALPEPAKGGLYAALNVVQELEVQDFIKLLHDIDAYVRKDARVRQVIATALLSHRDILILRPEGAALTDSQPMVRLNIQVVLEQDGKQERGYEGFGGRYSGKELLDPKKWQPMADRVIAQAALQFEAQPAPGGEMPVIMANGWSGVLFHEAVGHGLEGDFNRKGNSTFSGQVGQKVAPECVTIVDDGTIPTTRGALNMDDEGTPSARNVLIENGILKGYMQDRLNARLMGVAPTGNARRENYGCQVMPRMTNTYLTAGEDTQEEMLKGISKGLFCQTFGGGQVDIVSGNYVFEVSEAFLIENGQITAPVKGATLIGNGPTSLQYIDKVAGDWELDPGVGTCGKDGQSVPVGVGMPTIRLMGGLTVGGVN